MFRRRVRASEAGELAPFPALPPPVPSPSNNTFLTRAAIAALAVIVAFPGNSATLTEAGRAGSFVFRGTDFVAKYGASLAVIDPNQAVFIAPASDPTGASGAWVRKAAEGGYYVSLWWGVATSATATVNTLALRAALVTLKALSVPGYGYIESGALPLYTPTGHYLLNDELKPECAVDMYGDQAIMGGGTVLEWTGSSGHGIYIQGWDGSSHHGAGSAVRKLTLKGWYSGTRSAQHGIYVNGQARVEQIFGGYFPGDLVHGFADVASSNGNINLSVFRDIYGEVCDRTLFLQGADANACVVEGIQAQSNRFGSYKDASFFGQAASKIHAENCGLDPNFRSRCEKNGHIYAVAYGQEAWCSTNSPSGTTAHNLGWLYLGDGPTNFYTDTWVTGRTWYFTAPVMIYSGGSSQGRAEGIYVEGGMNPIILDGGASCTTTTTATVWLTDGTLAGGYMRGSGSHMLFNNGISAPGRNLFGGDVHDIGPQSGAAADLNLNLHCSNFATVINATRHDSDGTPHVMGSLQWFNGGVYLDSVFGQVFRYNGVNTAAVVAGGLDFYAGKVLSVNGTQVVAARDTGWTADTGTARKAANATYAAGTTLTYSAAYVQAEQTAMATRMAAVEAALQNISQTQKSIKDALIAHGLIG